jgi:hypothetical protein
MFLAMGPEHPTVRLLRAVGWPLSGFWRRPRQGSLAPLCLYMSRCLATYLAWEWTLLSSNMDMEFHKFCCHKFTFLRLNKGDVKCTAPVLPQHSVRQLSWKELGNFQVPGSSLSWPAAYSLCRIRCAYYEDIISWTNTLRRGHAQQKKDRDKYAHIYI